MNFLTSPELVRLEGNLPNAVQDVALKPHIENASFEMRRLLGSDLYKSVCDYEDSGDDSIDSFRQKECIKAETYLCLSYAVHSLNIETSGTGIVSSKGWGDSRSELLSQNEVNRLSTYYRDTAMTFLQSYLPTDETDTDDDGVDDSINSVNLGGTFMSAV